VKVDQAKGHHLEEYRKNDSPWGHPARGNTWWGYLLGDTLVGLHSMGVTDELATHFVVLVDTGIESATWYSFRLD